LLDHSIDNTKSGIDVFITSAYREQQSIIANNGYNILTCPLTGFCRYDNLSIHPEHRSRKILVMPTFRHWLMPSGRDNTAVSDDFEKFKDSEFCRTYNNLLSSAKVARLLNKFNYQLIFYPHYCTQPFLSCFIDNQRTDRVILASKEHYDVQKLLIESDILITDFSSVFFDFAYMKKPEIFYQFDEAQFRGGHYKEGYFKYREDAFGPVLTEEDEVIDYLQYLLENDSTIEDKYLSRIDGFFAYNDQNNCERTYQAIMNFKSEMR
jgi:CDP-glycerol glycerophosphotransferase (TagB/SpsB family)